MHRMRTVTTRQAKEIEKESVNILFDATSSIRKVVHSLVKTCRDSYKQLIMGRVPCSDEFFVKRLISKKEKEKKKKKRKEMKRKKERYYSLY